MIRTKIDLKELEELKLKYAYNPGNPIVNPNQMLPDIELEICEVDDIVEDLVHEHKTDALMMGVNQELIRQLEEKLCSFAGELVAFDKDDYAELILKHGQLWYGEDCYVANMPMGECHANSIEFNEENPDCPIVVGFGLSHYGFWYNHTWLLTQEEGKTVVIETTEPCELYFGVVLTELETETFKILYGAE